MKKFVGCLIKPLIAGSDEEGPDESGARRIRRAVREHLRNLTLRFDEYQYQLVRILDTALKETPLDAAQRQAVCEHFAFDLGVLHDQGNVEADDVEARPVLAFATGDVLRVPNEEFSLHEYAHGNVAEYFESED